ncbi:MAG: EAL domain-containing protein [Sulfurimonas sp.]
MKNISIKFFIIFILLAFMGSLGMIFGEFFKEAKNSTEQLLEENIQSTVLNLKHFLDKNLKKHNINQITASLDNTINGNALIKDLHIVDEKNKKVIYATDRDTVMQHPDTNCIPISQIINADIFNEQCYSFSIKLFDRFEPYYYKSYVYLDKKYIDSLLQNQINKYTIMFIGYGLFFIIVIWLLLKKFLVNPLEKLRQFAYYQTNTPKEFFIQELESIRYSLNLTFKRLQKEQEELFNLSTKDSLSGLYNRLSLMEKIDWLIAKGERSNEQFALLFLDLDNFKNINDTQGHEFGDKILQHVSKILLDSVRENDIVSRLGGDEFVIILPELKSNETVLEVIKRIQTRLIEPVVFNTLSYSVTVSIGITIYPKDGRDATTLLKHADIAMYKAKALGKNNFHFFTENLNEEIQNKIHMQYLIKEGIEKNYFQLYYQPKVDIKSNTIVGCEALIRLFDPLKGMIPPNQFISIAEESGLIVPLGEWIIKEAVQQIKSWKNTHFEHIKLSINVSGIQFQSPNFITFLQNNVSTIDTSKLDIELTESVLMNDFDEKFAKINAIKKLGISLSLDDFGTGYSSLSYLKQIPFDTIKIDKTFIDDLEEESGKSFVNMIVGIADDLNMQVVAEGVETKQQLDYLASIECEQYQGYYCSKPLPADEFEKLFLSQECH